MKSRLIKRRRARRALAILIARKLTLLAVEEHGETSVVCDEIGEPIAIKR